MKTELKKKIYNYLQNGGSEDERQKLIKRMELELEYEDLDAMALCTDDKGCADLNKEQLEKVADKLQDRLMESFNSELADVLLDLGY